MPGQDSQSEQFAPNGALSYVARSRPAVVDRAVAAMFVGAALSVVDTVWSVHVADVANIELISGFGIFGGVINLGLWVWMALVNRAGYNWARITGTVFFGLSTVSLVFSVIGYVLVKNAGAAEDNALFNVDGVSISLSAVSWLVGLVATVLIWSKGASPYFQPAVQYGPVGWAAPGAAPYGYQYPGSYPAQYPYPYPGQYPNPGQSPDSTPSGPVELAAEQADPWRTPED